ncbi:MAG TPA: hypothetical protein VF808_00290 [Ktedonobacterales bacterium]
MSQPEKPASEALARAGWTRRYTAIGSRLSEAIELYRALGFEVQLVAAEPDAEQRPASEACEQCFVMTLARTIYTRPTR